MSELVKPKDLDTDSTKEDVAEAAYYSARISDSTYNGTNFNAAQNVIVGWSKTHSRKPARTFANIYDIFEDILDERTA